MRDKILIVDDVEINREILAEILREEYEILMAESGSQALDILEKLHEEIAAILLDLVMPEMDGFAVLEELNQKPWSKQIAIMIISGDNTVQTEAKCFELGVADFVHRPFNNRLVKKRVHNVVALYQYQQELEQKVEKQTEVLRKQFRLLQQQADRLRQSKENVIDILYKTIKCEVIITDNNKVINVYSGSNKLKAVKNKTISMELEKLISSRAIQCKEFDNISISNGIELKEHCYYFSINENSFNVGSILVITNNKISEDLKNFILNQLTK